MTRSGEISRLRPITVPEKDDITVEGESIREASRAIDESRADHSASDIEQIRNGQILFRKQADFFVPRNSHGKQDVLPVPDFRLAVAVVCIENDLGSRVDRVERVARMLSLDHREIRQRFHIQKIGAGQHKEVAEHPVAVPMGGQFRQQVEYVAAAAPVLLYRRVDFRDERFEAVARIESAHANPGMQLAGEQRLVDALEGTLSGSMKRALRRCASADRKSART